MAVEEEIDFRCKQTWLRPFKSEDYNVLESVLLFIFSGQGLTSADLHSYVHNLFKNQIPLFIWADVLDFFA